MIQRFSIIITYAKFYTPAALVGLNEQQAKNL